MRGSLLFIWSMLIIGTGFAQNCIPDQSITEDGFHPKTIESAYVDVDYKQVLQLRVFKDTTVVLNGNPVVATIDSIVVGDIKGLPNGFYYTCSSKNCGFIPDSTGCATLEGKATKNQVGDHILEIEIEIFAKIFGSITTTQKDTLRQFVLVVEDLASVGEIAKGKILYPNPAINGTVSISQSIFNNISEISCVNAQGQNFDFQMVNNQLKITNGSSGLYTFLIKTKSGKTISQRILFTD